MTYIAWEIMGGKRVHAFFVLMAQIDTSTARLRFHLIGLRLLRC